MTHASLFSGIGGPEVAAAMLGWENAFHCEINQFGKTILDYWFPDSVSYEDITKTDFRDWRGKIDVLTGGFPCQPFSYAGKRGGQKDERYLWPQMLRAIDEIRPTWVVGENVAGIITMVEGGVLTDLGCEAALFQEGDDVHRYALEQSFTIERICRDLECAGYSVQPMLIPAAAVGAPHRRDRVFIIAHVADADDSCAGRETGKHESERGEERIQKRNEVQFAGESNQVRSTFVEDVADSYGERREEPFKPGRKEDYAKTGTGMDDRTLRFSSDGPSPDSNVQRRDERIDTDLSGEEKRQYRKKDCCRFDTFGLDASRRWREFPTVSPVHRGNDGLPFPLDDLTIPSSKWRNESLKAYGNAIVPQVMYEIFRAIEEVSK